LFSPFLEIRVGTECFENLKDFLREVPTASLNGQAAACACLVDVDGDGRGGAAEGVGGVEGVCGGLRRSH
jgi:hypothetical protein